MKKNIGSLDQTLRIIVGLIIIALGVIYQSWWGLVGIIPLLTGFVKSCPLYIPLGISTDKKEEPKK
jgi:hypothetical protein